MAKEPMMMTLNKIVITRKFQCGPKELFNWLVQPELVARWFGPKHFLIGTVHTDLRVGGHYSIELKSANHPFFIEGEYLEIEAPNKLVFSFQYRGLSSRPPDSIVRITIEEETENESLLSLTQDFVSAPSDMEKRTESWEYMVSILSKHIAKR